MSTSRTTRLAIVAALLGVFASAPPATANECQWYQSYSGGQWLGMWICGDCAMIYNYRPDFDDWELIDGNCELEAN